MIVTVATGGIKNIKPTSPTGWLAEFLYLSEVLYLVILLLAFPVRTLVQRRSFGFIRSLPLVGRRGNLEYPPMNKNTHVQILLAACLIIFHPLCFAAGVPAGIKNADYDRLLKKYVNSQGLVA